MARSPTILGHILRGGHTFPILRGNMQVEPVLSFPTQAGRVRLTRIVILSAEICQKTLFPAVREERLW